MKRKMFLRATAGTVALFTASLNSLGKIMLKLRDGDGFKVEAGKDRYLKPITVFEQDVFLTKVSGKDTDGDLYVYESSRLKGGGPNHHFHFDQDEWWYVLQGEFLIKIGNVMHRAKVGDSVFGPRMVPHSFANIGEGEGRLLQIFQPAGKMEAFFIKQSQGITKNMTEEEQDELRRIHGFKRVGPPIDYSKYI